MTSGDEAPTHLKEEGFSLRDAGLTVAEAVGAVGVTAALADWVPWMAEVPATQWLEDAHGSRLRGTDISTLAVRYDVDADWLESELSRFAPTPRV